MDTYRYFGDPVYVYLLEEGISEGYLTPFKVKQIQTTLDYYLYTPDDTVVEGEVEQGRVYDEPDFNHRIEIREREQKRVAVFMVKPTSLSCNGIIDDREMSYLQWLCAMQSSYTLLGECRRCQSL